MHIIIDVSDIVFLRAWYPIEVPQFYNPVTSLLLPPEEKKAWIGMKTLGQLRRERGISLSQKQDSLYKVLHNSTQLVQLSLHAHVSISKQELFHRIASTLILEVYMQFYLL